MDGRLNGASPDEATPFHLTDAFFDPPVLKTTVTPQKRPASTILESEPRKTPRIEGEDEVSRAGTSTESVEIVDQAMGDNSSTTGSTKQQGASASEVRRLEERLAKVKNELEVSDGQHHLWRSRAVTAEKKEERLRKAYAKLLEESEEGVIEGSRDLDEAIREEYEEERQKDRAEFQKKHDKAAAANKKSLETRDARYKRDLNAEKDIRKTREMEHKDDITELKDTHKKELKAQEKKYADAQKNNLQEQKAKREEVASLSKEINGLNASKTTLEGQLRETLANLSVSREEHRLKDKRYKALEEQSRNQSRENMTADEAIAAMRVKCDQELKRESQRWEIQFTKASDLEQQSIDDRRANTTMRQSNERLIKDIQTLDERIAAATRDNEALRSEADRMRRAFSTTTMRGIEKSHDVEDHHAIKDQHRAEDDMLMHEKPRNGEDHDAEKYDHHVVEDSVAPPGDESWLELIEPKTSLDGGIEGGYELDRLGSGEAKLGRGRSPL